jgi:hypothetical protein
MKHNERLLKFKTVSIGMLPLHNAIYEGANDGIVRMIYKAYPKGYGNAS